MKNKYIYNTSDVGYMDEEWISYDIEPISYTDGDLNEKLKENEEESKKV